MPLRLRVGRIFTTTTWHLTRETTLITFWLLSYTPSPFLRKGSKDSHTKPILKKREQRQTQRNDLLPKQQIIAFKSRLLSDGNGSNFDSCLPFKTWLLKCLIRINRIKKSYFFIQYHYSVWHQSYCHNGLILLQHLHLLGIYNHKRGL